MSPALMVTAAILAGPALVVLAIVVVVAADGLRLPRPVSARRAVRERARAHVARHSIPAVLSGEVVGDTVPILVGGAS